MEGSAQGISYWLYMLINFSVDYTQFSSVKEFFNFLLINFSVD